VILVVFQIAPNFGTAPTRPKPLCVTVRIRRDASMAEKVGDFDVQAQLSGQVQGIEIRFKLARRRTDAPRPWRAHGEPERGLGRLGAL
jgi:hypothetical protein